MAEEVARVQVAIEATNATASGIKDAADSVRSGTQEIAESVATTGSAAEAASGSFGSFSDVLKTHGSESKQAAQSARFFTNEIGELVGKGTQAASVLGNLAGAVASGSMLGVGMVALKAAIDLGKEAWDRYRESTRELHAFVPKLTEVFGKLAEEMRKVEEEERKLAKEITQVGKAETEKRAEDLEGTISANEQKMASNMKVIQLQEQLIPELRAKAEQLYMEGKIHDGDLTMQMVRGAQHRAAELRIENDELNQINITLQNQITDVDELAKAKHKLKSEETVTAAAKKTTAATTKTESKEESEAEKAMAAYRKDEEAAKDYYARKDKMIEENKQKIDAKVLELENRKQQLLTQLDEEGEKRRVEAEVAAENTREQLAKKRVAMELKAIDAISSATTTMVQDMIEDYRNAGKAMLKAVLSSVKSMVMAYMAEAAAAALAGNSGIPVVGVALGTAAAALAFGVGEAYLEKIPSAAGGMDVPPGLNPLTHLHEREMVLPAAIADPLRAALATSGGLPTAPNIYISGIDGPSIQRLVESQAFNDAISENLRNGR